MRAVRVILCRIFAFVTFFLDSYERQEKGNNQISCMLDFLHFFEMEIETKNVGKTELRYL